MKYEIEAAAEFLTTLLFPPPQTPIALPHSQSAPSLHPPTPIATYPIATPQTNNIKVHTIATVEDNEKRAKLFSKALSKTLAKRYANHWYENEAIKGQAYRSILVDCESNFIDRVIVTSARKVNLKNVEEKLKSATKKGGVGAVGFRMWIDPGEVEVEFFPPSNSSPNPPYKTSPPNHLVLYSTRRPISSLPSSPPPSSPSFLTSSSPPSSPAHSSYFPYSADTPKKAIFTRQSKPIRISNRQHDGDDDAFAHKSNDRSKDENINSDDHPLHLLPGDFAVLQPAM